MNNGKICISVCAKTADELLEHIKRAEELADVIEIRFDCLDKVEPEQLWSQLKEFRKNFQGKLLTTFRCKEQGGNNDLSFEDRQEFWFSSYVDEFTDWADLEEDILIENLKNSLGINVFEKFIKSNHDFNGVPKDLIDIYERLKTTQTDIVKIAVQTHDITDSIAIWQLLKRAKSENKEIIPIAMGESGKWTRILGLGHGAFLTYASLNSGNETAPGQVTAKDLIEVYRAKELNETTEVYGIIGSNTGVSLSPYIHNPIFKNHQLNAVFVPLQVHNLDEFIAKMVKPETREIDLNFKGFSVTIPHKQDIIKHLDYLDETAEKIGAVNTVKIVDGKLHGYNTDAKGFIEPLKKVYGDLAGVKVAILGSGGSARACVYALKKENAEVTIFARNIEKSKDLAENFDVDLQELRTANDELKDFDIVVNTTPLGMKGKAEGETPLAAEQLQGVKLVYDLVYIPEETQFIKDAQSLNIQAISGIEMLLAQGVEQQRIWTDLESPIEEIRKIITEKLK